MIYDLMGRILYIVLPYRSYPSKDSSGSMLQLGGWAPRTGSRG